MTVKLWLHQLKFTGSQWRAWKQARCDCLWYEGANNSLQSALDTRAFNLEMLQRWKKQFFTTCLEPTWKTGGQIHCFIWAWKDHHVHVAGKFLKTFWSVSVSPVWFSTDVTNSNHWGVKSQCCKKLLPPAEKLWNVTTKTGHPIKVRILNNYKLLTEKDVKILAPRWNSGEPHWVWFIRSVERLLEGRYEGKPFQNHSRNLWIKRSYDQPCPNPVSCHHSPVSSSSWVD